MSRFCTDDIYSLMPDELCRKLSISIARELGSTNTELKKLARAGAEEGRVLIALKQSGGRGRLGRSFYSPNGTGLYISVLVRPRLKAEETVFVTAMSAVCMARAIDRLCGKHALIKWVNDIFLDAKKVCGILCESAFEQSSMLSEYVVIGAGVNIYPPENGFPEDISSVAGALFDNALPDELRPRLAAEFLKELFAAYGSLEHRSFLDEYKSRSMVCGRRINVIAPEGSREADALYIDDSCRLVVRYDDGIIAPLSKGEISIRLK